MTYTGHINKNMPVYVVLDGDTFSPLGIYTNLERAIIAAESGLERTFCIAEFELDAKIQNGSIFKNVYEKHEQKEIDFSI